MKLSEDEILLLGLLKFVVQSVGPSAPPDSYLPLFEALEKKGLVERTGNVSGTEQACWNITVKGRSAIGETLH